MHSKRSDPYIKVLDTFFPRIPTIAESSSMSWMSWSFLESKSKDAAKSGLWTYIYRLSHTHTHRQTWNSRTTHWQLYSAVTDSFVLHSAAGRAHTRKFFLAGRNASLRKLLRLENVSVEEEEKCSPYLYACGRKRTVDHGLGFNTFPVAYELTNSDQKQ